MNRLHLRTTVLSGAAIGLVAGAAAFGAVSSPVPTPSRAAFTAPAPPVAAAPARAKPARPAPARPARCAAGAKLRKGVCIVHVVRTVVIPAPGNASGQGSMPSASGTRVAGPTGNGRKAVQHARPARHTPEAESPAPAAEHRETAQHVGEAPEEARDTAEDAGDTAEGARDTAEDARGTAEDGAAAVGRSTDSDESEDASRD
jgi:hypothetical protein